ncbi:hypothetical protein NKR23_g8045 [Pleurostoma richardsiae]|uniref:Uncharacterized protein n=1 Tax=Pleurostoma richardsiae TaxID=41990 RepID=A0AA38R8U0_9PEZI|nr:hypothetical protein NKR23_g8045 [Pleurostoma richardsiae]
MPSVTQHTGFVLSKKRRRGENSTSGDIPLPFSEDIQHSQNIFAASLNDHHNTLFQHGHHDPLSLGQPHLLARKIMPLPPTKRLRLNGEEDVTTHFLHEDKSQQDRQDKRDSIGSERRRSPKQPAKELQQTSGNSRPASVLSPCHICHRRPTKKSDLDAFADCEGCGQRTCYICIRQCLSWGAAGGPTQGEGGGGRDEDEDGEMLRDRPPSQEENLSASFHMEDALSENDQRHNNNNRPPDGTSDKSQDWGQKDSSKAEQGWAAGGRGGHRQTICSRCCVERGADGDVVCLGCLSFLEG